MAFGPSPQPELLFLREAVKFLKKTQKRFAESEKVPTFAIPNESEGVLRVRKGFWRRRERSLKRLKKDKYKQVPRKQ